MHPDKRFATIDALRGLAAIGVMLFHVRQDVGFQVPGGYLAVDLFFCLSGFVIGRAYEMRLRDGLGAREFVERRIVRLWPMLALGALLGIAIHGGHAGMLFLLPNWLSDGLLYPANPPLWSLLFEMVAYIAFALVLHRLNTLTLALIAGAAGLVLAGYSGTPMRFADLGADWVSFGAGFARVGYAFSAGVIVHRVTISRTTARLSTLGWILALPLAGVFMLVGEADNRAALAFVLLGVPAFTAAASQVEVPQLRIAAFLGDASYPLYCIHVPLLALMAGAGDVAVLTACAALVIASVALERLLDRPLRSKLDLLRKRGRAEVRPASA
ncbi:acyltransferase family protein [Qipengyuania sp. RANM35]|uniref:acyltransferase family protein n=1 Tax=Qipengyuania sp. RANM35 TaxID=3068635 RepID=UPI0034DB5669